MSYLVDFVVTQHINDYHVGDRIKIHFSIGSKPIDAEVVEVIGNQIIYRTSEEVEGRMYPERRIKK